MKKILIVLACIALVLPLFALSAFAEDSPYSVDLYNGYSQNTGSPCLFTFERKLYGSNDSFVFWQTLSLSRGQESSLLFDVGFDYRISCRYGGGAAYPILGLSVNGASFPSSSDPFIWDDSSSLLRLNVSNSSSTSPSYRYISIPSIDPLSPVNDGVNTFIGYGGDVLHFIVNNSTLLFLIGLSVGLCFVIPFGVSKIKDLLKGY